MEELIDITVLWTKLRRLCWIYHLSWFSVNYSSWYLKLDLGLDQDPVNSNTDSKVKFQLNKIQMILHESRSKCRSCHYWYYFFGLKYSITFLWPVQNFICRLKNLFLTLYELRSTTRNRKSDLTYEQAHPTSMYFYEKLELLP